MGTIKNYTSLEQSKQLAEILPIETADAIYPWRELIKDYDSVYVPEDMPDIGEEDIPCWSLAALLDVLPYSIYDNTDEYSQLEFTKKSVAYHDINDGIKIGSLKNNLVDACVETITKLKELNML